MRRYLWKQRPSYEPSPFPRPAPCAAATLFKLGALARGNNNDAKSLLHHEKNSTAVPEHAKYIFVQKSMRILSGGAYQAVADATLGAALQIWLRDGHAFYPGCKEHMASMITK